MVLVSPPRSFNFADLWEAVAPHLLERTAAVCGRQRCTFAELAARVNQLARHFLASGVQPGDHVGICMPNRVEYVETMLAAFTVRAVPVNLNFRYRAAELRPLLESDGSRLVVGDSSVAGEVREALAGRARCEVLEVNAPGADSAYEAAIAAQSGEPLRVEGRTGDDHYVIYTGGTTGSPKGVVWRQEDAFFACIGGGDPTRLAGPVETPAEVVERAVQGMAVSYLPVAPLMHAAAQWTTLSWLYAGGKTVLMPGSLDPRAVWQAVQDEQANMVTVVGDAVGRPLLKAWLAEPGRWDVSSLFGISNGGAPMSPSLKAAFGEAFPGLMLIDGFGSSETGVQGSERLQPGEEGRGSGLARFVPYRNTVVLGDDLQPLEPGSAATGRVALSGRIPLGYHNDPEKTAASFVEVDGVRHVITGDLATVAADGTIQLLGRGSQCINTGGEKVFPEEVEAALHAHPAIEDVVVVGVPDERWGSAVVAVAAVADPDAPPTLDELRDFCRPHLAGYKLPKRLVIVDQVQRSPAGKPDYRWAMSIARAERSPAAPI